MKKFLIAILSIVLIIPLLTVLPASAQPIGDNDASSGKWDAVPGDVTGDGIVNTMDITFIRRYLAGGYDISMNTGAADVNDDNLINTLDITLIRRYLADGYDTVLK